MASDKQIAANKQNPLKHGLTSGFTLLSTESQEDFDNLLSELEAEFEPTREHHKYLLTLMAEARFKRDRAHRFEAQYFERTLNGEEVDSKIALMHRYATAAERAYHKAHKELIDDLKLLHSLQPQQQQPQEEEEGDFDQAIERFFASPEIIAAHQLAISEYRAKREAQTNAFARLEDSFRTDGEPEDNAA